MAETAARKKIWTIIDLISWGTSYLGDKKIDDARLNIELLLASVLKLKRIQLYTNFDKPLDEAELFRFKELLKRRLANEPIQYILGETEFMGLPFYVDPHVLIPRPDTEVLVESAISAIRHRFPETPAVDVFDIGTGSGCVAVSIAKLLPTVTVTAIDFDPHALAVASKNAGANGVEGRIVFEQADYLNGYRTEKKFHCIVSNPPYISTEEYRLLPDEVQKYEPKFALTDDGDGLSFFRAIASQASGMLTDNGFVIVEHAYDQTEAVQSIFTGRGWGSISTVKDYGGHFRCVIAHLI